MAPTATAPKPPAPPPPAPAPHVPPGCEADLSGAYRHRDDATFRYDVRDDGALVHVVAYRQFGETRQLIASPAADITLRRTPHGLVGEAQTRAPTLSGRRMCPVTFPYEITACAKGQLTLQTVREVRLAEDCTAQDAAHRTLVESVLLRVDPPLASTADAGIAADAGDSTDGGARALLAADAGAPGRAVEPAPNVATDGGAAARPQPTDASDAGQATPPSVTQGVATDAGNTATP